MKKVSLVLLMVLIFTACNSDETVDEVKDDTESTESETVDNNEVKEEEKPEARDIVNEKNEFLVEADSVLVDDTNIGFNYEPAMVSDQDFSTSWCTKGGGAKGELIMTFQEFVKAEKVGIVPGFGRDDVIYFQNNRIKELEISFATDGDFGDAKTVELSDEYKMHFIDLEGAEFNKVKFEIKDIYKGSKYKDTCIAEVDFWSDFVKSEDAKAAMNYYVKYEKDFALEPYDIIGKVVFSDAPSDKCGSPGKLLGDEGYSFVAEDGSNVFSGLPIYVSAYVNEYGREGDLLDLKWYGEVLDFESEPGEAGFKSLGWDLSGVQGGIPVVRSCDGKLYLHSNSENLASVTGPILGEYKVYFYNKGKLVGSGKFGLTQ